MSMPMAFRLGFPQAYDPQMYREEALTLSRTTSQPQPQSRVDGNVGNEELSAMTAKLSTLPPKSAPPAPQRRHYVFADPVAFRYLEDDFSTVVIERRGKLAGYELYIVEQWACSRVDPTFVIATYTGDPSHSITVGVLGVPADENAWSPRLRVYFKSISQFHARAKETPLGMLMVTNLSSFPSALTVIPVPDGDVRKHREDFIVNENLKRLGCSGRSGMSLCPPAGATQAKFLQLYKTSDQVPLYGAVIELVKLCQIALMLFGKLEQEYADGCLCDVTEKAIGDWWTEIGSEYYNVEPTDGILGPTTVAALLGMLIGARNRLNYFGAPVAKDAFDVYSLKRGISYFQKAQKLERTRRLDRITLNRLHRVTAKAAAGEGWGVPKAVKSTVAELSGKGGEMVMGMVGRDKAGIADVETLDLDRFVNLIHGERAKWLWLGKPRRNITSEPFGKSDPDGGNLSFTKDDQGGYMWSHSRSDSVPPETDSEKRRKEKEESPINIYANKPPPTSAISMQEMDRKNVLKSVTGKMSTTRSGFGRIKDAVTRSHANKHSKDEGIENYYTPITAVGPGYDTPIYSANKAFTWKNTPEKYENGIARNKDPVTGISSVAHDSDMSFESTKVNIPSEIIIFNEDKKSKSPENETRWAEQVRKIREDVVAKDPSIAGSVYGDGDLEGPVLEAERASNNNQILLFRRHSVSGSSPVDGKLRNEAWWPRQMSFTDVEEAVLGWEPVCGADDEGDNGDNWAALQKQNNLAAEFKQLYEKIVELQEKTVPWVEKTVDGVEALDEQAAQDQEEFQTLYYQLTEQYQAVKQNSDNILRDERSHAAESIKDIDVMGAKLEYEINALVSRVQDVEDGVVQFERQVDHLEGKAAELETQLSTESWAHWMVRRITGIGMRPTIPAVHRDLRPG